MEPSTRAFKRFRGSFRVPYPFFVELVELVKQRDWFPTGQEDAVGRPCIPVELKVSRTDCHDSYQEKRGSLHATTVSGSVYSCVCSWRALFPRTLRNPHKPRKKNETNSGSARRCRRGRNRKILKTEKGQNKVWNSGSSRNGLTQDFPNKILFHFLWEQHLVQNLPKIFRWPEMCSFGQILAQDFQMAAVTKILMRRENQLRRYFPWGISRKHLKHKNAHGDCDAAIAKAATTVTHVQSLSQEVSSGDEGLGLFGFDLSSTETDFDGWERSRGGGMETNTCWHRPGDMASEEAGEFECCFR